MFCDYCFLSIFDASINFIRCFPLIIKRKKKENKNKNKKTKTLNPWIDLVNLKVLFSPHNKKEKKGKQKQKQKNKNTESMDRSCKFEGVVSQKLERT